MEINSLDDILKITDIETMLSDNVFEYLLNQDSLNFERNVQQVKDYIKTHKKTLDCLKTFNAILKEKKQSLQNNSISVFKAKLPDTTKEIKIKTKDYYIDEENHQIIKKQTKQGSNIPICESIIIPYSIISDIQTDSKMSDVLYLDTDFEWKSKRVTISALTNISSLINQLGSVCVGITSNNAKEMISFFQEIISINSKLFLPKKAVSFFGWKSEYYSKDDSFIPFSEECEYLGGDSEGKQIYDSIMKPSGTLEDWIEYTSVLRTHLPTRLVMDASFASPLLQLLDTDPFSILLYGATGLGKSHCNYVAMSIWGKSKIREGLTFSLEATKNYIPRLLSTLKNIPACFDELKLYDDDLNKLMYLISQGQEKGRMSSNKETGDVITKKRKCWKNITLFSGEFPITSYSSDAGALNRLLQIKVENKMPMNFDKIREFVSTNYGTAGREFIKHILNLNTSELKRKLTKTSEKIIENADTTDKQALLMGILLLADELAGEIFYPKEKKLEIDEVSQYLCSEEEISYGIRAYKTFINLAYEKQLNFYRISKDGKDLNEKPKIFWGEIKDGSYIKILKNALYKLLSDVKLNPEQAIEEWKANDMVTLTKTRKLTSQQTSVRGNPGTYIFVNLLDKYISEQDIPSKNGKIIHINKALNGNDYLIPSLKEKIDNDEQVKAEDF